MSRFTKFALLTLAAFFVTGFAITADAKRVKLQTLKSAPLIGESAHCLVHNATEMEISVDVFMFGPSGPFYDFSHSIAAKGFVYAGDPLGAMAACEVSWEGEHDDVRATFCADTWIGGDWNNPARTCIEMR